MCNGNQQQFMLLHIQQTKLHFGLIIHVLGTTTFMKRECKRNQIIRIPHTASACRSRKPLIIYNKCSLPALRHNYSVPPSLPPLPSSLPLSLPPFLPSCLPSCLPPSLPPSVPHLTPSLLDHQIFINEDLTACRGKLAYDTRQLKTAHKFSDCWTTYGKVMVKDIAGRLTEVKSPGDLAQF